MFINKDDLPEAEAISEEREMYIRKYIQDKVITGNWKVSDIKTIFKGTDELYYLMERLKTMVKDDREPSYIQDYCVSFLSQTRTLVRQIIQDEWDAALAEKGKINKGPSIGK